MNNRVYIIKCRLENNQGFIYKIGKSSGKNSVDRMMQLIRSFFMNYRYTPIFEIKRDRPCENAFAIETQLHQDFRSCKYYHDKKIDGANEWFYVPREDLLLQRYDELLPLGKK